MGGANLQRHLCNDFLWCVKEACLQVACLRPEPGRISWSQ